MEIFILLFKLIYLFIKLLYLFNKLFYIIQLYYFIICLNCWIFLSSAGYITAFAEDDPEQGAFSNIENIPNLFSQLDYNYAQYFLEAQKLPKTDEHK